MQRSPTHRDFWSQLCLLTFTELSTNMSRLAHRNLSGSAPVKQGDTGKERTCWIFWHKTPILPLFFPQSLCYRQLNRVWTKTQTVAHSQTDASISQTNKGEKKNVRLNCFTLKKKVCVEFPLYSLGQRLSVTLVLLRCVIQPHTEGTKTVQQKKGEYSYLEKCQKLLWSVLSGWVDWSDAVSWW